MTDEVSTSASPDSVVFAEPVEGDSSFDEAARLWPEIGRYRKLITSVVTTSLPLAYFLLDTRSPKEILAAGGAFVLTNLGVYGVAND